MKTRHFIPFLLLSLFGAFSAHAQQLDANFRADKENGCAPAIINFQDLSFGNPSSYLWDFGNGNTSTLRNPATTYLNPGKYTIRLIVGNAEGKFDTLTKEQYINIFDNPKPDFTATSVSGCSPVRVQFNDLSVADTASRIVKWAWDMGDGSLDEGASPAHVYRGTGDFAVTLKVTDDKGCTGVVLKPKFINVTPGVNTSFTNTKPTVCSAPANVTFNNTSTGPGTLTHQWLFGDGSSSTEKSPTHTYTTNDTFTVRLIVRSSEGCYDTLTRRGAVILGGYKTDFALKDSVCPGGTAQIINTSMPAPSSAQWFFADGTTSTRINPDKIFPNAGPVQIKLVNNYSGCIDTLVKTLTVSAPPVISFSATDTSKCAAPFTTRFVNTGTAAKYFWEFGDSTFSTEASPSHTFTEEGTFSVSLTATSAAGCVATFKKTDYIRIIPPQVRFSNLPLKGCVPYQATFKSRVTSVEPVASYSWDFGDGQKSTEKEPRHTYTATGNYKVTLTITTAGGCTQTITMNDAVRVGTKTKAEFTANPLDVCASTSINFTNQTPDADEYLWQFGDGGSSKAPNPTYEFSDTGYLDVTLIAFRNGCGDTLKKVRYVHIKPPIAKFSFTPNCDKPLEFTFKDESIVNTEPGVQKNWQWNFGDGTTSNVQNPGLHVFPKQGTYKVALALTNGECTHTQTQTIYIGPRKIDFNGNPLVACKPARVQLAPVNTNMSGIQSLVWTITNGQEVIRANSSNEGLNTTINVAGNFDVTLTTIDNFGCRRDSVTKLKYLRVNGPKADFDSPNRSTCTGRTVDFLDKSATDGVNAIVKWEWSFGINNTDTVFTAPPFSKVYDSTGLFNVRLKVTDNAGCSDAVIKRDFVRTTVIKPSFTGDTQTCPNGTGVQFNNTTPGSGLKFAWNFGDGGTATTATPTHVFKDTGYYSVMLKVTNEDGCTDSLTQANFVYSGRPKASFEANNLVSFCTPFEAKFTNTSTYFTSLLWDLSQGTSTLPNPVAYYTNKGTYNIKLVATSPGGCKDEVVKQLVVRDPSQGKLTYEAKTGCSPLQIDFEAFEEMNGRFVWDFGNGNVIDTTVNKISHIYRDFGSYLPSVILYEPAGCILTKKGRDTINAIGVDAKFGINQNLFCDEGMLRVSDSTRTNDRFVRYFWSFGDGGTSTASNPIHFYNKPGDYLVQLVTETQSGCRDTSAAIPVRISTTPVITMVGDTVLCERERRPYSGILHNLDSASVKWRWVLPNGSGTTAQSPGMQLFPQAGTFSIMAVAANFDGCADTITKSIRVHPRPTVTIQPLFTIPAGGQVLLPPNYSSSVRQYFWSPAEGLSCTDCPSPTAGPAQDTRYTINVLDSNGCPGSAETHVDVVCNGANVFAPNTFSPNGDGRNDVFFLRGTGVDRVRMLRVFNRWGEVVFERREFPINDASVGWNGMFKGSRPQPDVYVFQAEVYCITGEIIRLEGNVALIQ